MDKGIKLFVAKLLKEGELAYRITDSSTDMGEITSKALQHGYSASIKAVDFDLTTETFASFVWDNYVAPDVAPSSVSEEAQAQE